MHYVVNVLTARILVHSLRSQVEFSFGTARTDTYLTPQANFFVSSPSHHVLTLALPVYLPRWLRNVL